MVRHLGVAGVMGLACLGMALGWQTVWVYPILLLAAPVMGLVGRDRLDGVFYALGLTLGAGIDVLQSGTGVTVYAAPAPFLFLPVFVFLYWGLAFVAVRHLIALLPQREFHVSDLVLLVGSVGLSAFANRTPVGVTVAMLALLALRFCWVRRRYDLLAAALGMVVGPGSESVLLSHGLYHFPSAGGALLPAWLLALYACVGVAARGLVPWVASSAARARTGRAPVAD